MNRQELLKEKEKLTQDLPSLNIQESLKEKERFTLRSPSLNIEEELKKKEQFIPKTVDTTPSVVTPIDAVPLKKLSKKDLINDEQYYNDVLQYREDRFGTDKKEGTNNLLFGFIKGELNQENLVDDFLDHYRFMTGNEVDAAQELDWLKGLKKKEELALQNAKNAKVPNEETRYLDEAKKFSDMRKRAARIYSKTLQLGDLTDSKRYEGMSV